MNNFKTVTLSLAAITAITLTGCGGGSVDSSTPAGTPAATPANPATSYTYTQAIVAESATFKSADTTTLDNAIITADTNLTADTVYTLNGLVEVQSGAVLNIAAGTTIIGTDGAYIVVETGAQIVADGNITDPITFTSKIAYDGGVSETGQWGGLTILGKATTNHDTNVNLTTGRTGAYYEVSEDKDEFIFGGAVVGGAVDNDNSGVLRYVNILNSGSVIGTDVEINGLSLCGVGSGTTVENINVVNSSDDGIEVWGGTVNMSNLTIVGALDDSLDLDYGYSGIVDGVTVSQTEAAHAGFEISSGGDVPMTEATIKNFSITKFNGSDEGGIYIKDDTTAPTFINGSVVVKGTDAALNVRKLMTTDQINAISFDAVGIDAATLYDGTGAAQIQTIYEASLPSPTLTDTTTLDNAIITADTNLTADTVYTLNGLVEVQSGAVLNIAAGTTIIGTDGAYIVVETGAQIVADGNITDPITFTSKIAYDGGVSETGQWGGLTILGKATTNHDTNVNLTTGRTGAYYEVSEDKDEFIFGGAVVGGAVDNDNSGVLRYVNILNSGSVIGTDVEINGLSLCGVGSGTTVENINVVNSSDDGIEVWGGTVNMSNLTIVGALDDSLDLDYGYSGIVDGVTVSQTEAAHAGFEISSGGDVPMTEATIKNFSITKFNGSDEGGIYIKDDTTAPTFINGSVVVKGTDAALNVRKTMVADQYNAISFTEVILDSSTRYSGDGATQIETKLEN